MTIMTYNVMFYNFGEMFSDTVNRFYF